MNSTPSIPFSSFCRAGLSLPQHVSLTILLALLLQSFPQARAGSQVAELLQRQEEAWAAQAEILKKIQPPVFPARDFVLTDFGAVGDGISDSTQAFRDAIRTCHEAGGGRVVVPPGVFLTGAIHLKSKVNLHLSKEATIRFSKDPDHFLPVVFARFESTEVMNYSPFIYALEETDIAVTGEGTLDGQASDSIWHSWKITGREDEKRLVAMGDRGIPVSQRTFGAGHKLRPNFIQPMRCQNVLIEGVRIIDSPMWAINPVYCTNVIVRAVRVETKGRDTKAPNTDGCNPESSNYVLIENCTFNTDDDCIAIKSGRDADGRRVNIPSQNIVIRDCKFQAGHGGVTAGSETAAGIRNVFIERCSFDSPNLRMAIRIKSNPRRGGFVENFLVRNCQVKTAITGIHMTLQYDRVTEGEAIPHVKNVFIDQVHFGKLKQAVFIEGLPSGNWMSDVLINRCTFDQTEQKSRVAHATDVHFRQTSGLTLE